MAFERIDRQVPLVPSAYEHICCLLVVGVCCCSGETVSVGLN